MNIFVLMWIMILLFGDCVLSSSGVCLYRYVVLFWWCFVCLFCMVVGVMYWCSWYRVRCGMWYGLGWYLIGCMWRIWLVWCWW